MKRSAAAIVLAALLLPSPISAELAEHASTVSDRQSVNLTVYNAGASLVHDRRRIDLQQGTSRVAWRDVSAQMDPTSALLDGSVGVLEQNFNYDILSPSTILQKYVGNVVTVVHPASLGRPETRERARILSASDDGIVLQYAGRIETDLHGGYIVYPALPKNLRDRPTLDIDLQSPRAGVQTLDLSYLTGGLSWYANYVGVLSPNERSLDLTGLVTLSNESGVDYDNARLQLVAGNINAPQQGAPVAQALRTISDVYVARPTEENYFEYHLYTYDRPTTILDRQTKQLTLLEARDVPVRKTLELRGSPSYYQSAQADLGERIPVGVYLSFANRGGDLGVPLPAGLVRVYKNDSHGLSQFAGSDTIDHTPAGETVRLHLGDSFDVTARKRQTDYRVIGGCTSQSSYDIVLSNAKTAPQDVLVVEQIPGDWLITAENRPYRKTSSGTASWSVRVPARGKADLRYTATASWC